MENSVKIVITVIYRRGILLMLLFVISKREKIIEVTYVGTHEKAYYGRLC